MWGREMRAGLVFVIGALLVGHGFREWRRGHEERFQDLVQSLEERDKETRERPPASSFAEADTVKGGSKRAERRVRAHHDVPAGRIDPNRASSSDLERLPGIGPALARRILEDRERNGAFQAPESLLRVPGIGPKTLDRIRGFLLFPAMAGEDSVGGF